MVFDACQLCSKEGIFLSYYQHCIFLHDTWKADLEQLISRGYTRMQLCWGLSRCACEFLVDFFFEKGELVEVIVVVRQGVEYRSSSSSRHGGSKIHKYTQNQVISLGTTTNRHVIASLCSTGHDEQQTSIHSTIPAFTQIPCFSLSLHRTHISKPYRHKTRRGFVKSAYLWRLLNPMPPQIHPTIFSSQGRTDALCRPLIPYPNANIPAGSLPVSVQIPHRHQRRRFPRPREALRDCLPSAELPSCRADSGEDVCWGGRSCSQRCGYI